MVKFVGEKNYEHGSKDKTGVLITNLGTPDAPDAKALRKTGDYIQNDKRVFNTLLTIRDGLMLCIKK